MSLLTLAVSWDSCCAVPVCSLTKLLACLYTLFCPRWHIICFVALPRLLTVNTVLINVKNICDFVLVCGHHLGFIFLSPSLPGKPSAWCVRLFQGPKELCGRERYTGMDRKGRREGDGVIIEVLPTLRKMGNVRGKQEAALAIHLPVHVLYIALPLSVLLPSPFLHFKKRGKTERGCTRRRERLRSEKRDEEVWDCMCVGVAPAHDALHTAHSA